MSVILDTIELPEDLRWADEYAWLPVASQVDVTCGGSLLVEESAQLAGRPITLESGTDGDGRHWAVVTRETVEALRALAAAAQADPLELELEDGRTFDVRFRHGDGVAVEARPVKHIAPHENGDYYHLTLRLLQV